MTWTAPSVVRVDEPFVADERTMLQGYLEWQRATLLHKCAGLSGDQLARQAVPPSTLSLLGLIRHLIDVERTWFRRRFGGEDVASAYVDTGRNGSFSDVDPQKAEIEYAALVHEWQLCRRAVAGAPLDETFSHPTYGPMQLRWIFQHMIEEYARHNGHADLLRERIDGVTGT